MINFKLRMFVPDKNGNKEYYSFIFDNLKFVHFDYLRKFITDMNYQMSTSEISDNLLGEIDSYHGEILRVTLRSLKRDLKNFKNDIYKKEPFELYQLGYFDDGITTVREELADFLEKLISKIEKQTNDEIRPIILVVSSC